MSNAVPSGTYYISSQLTQTVLTLTSGEEGTNLTAWLRFDGPEQQVREQQKLAIDSVLMMLNDEVECVKCKWTVHVQERRIRPLHLVPRQRCRVQSLHLALG